jgi:ketosteroid isomerase-like protein
MAQTDEEALIAAEYARRAAIVRDDADALEAGMADHFHYAHINGMVEDRAAFLMRIRAKVVRTPRTEATDLNVTLRDGYALLTGKSYIEFAWTTHENSGFVETLFTSVWEKHDGRWQISAYASTPLPA